MSWPEVQTGERYKILAGWYTGEVGTVIEAQESQFGHRWALLELDDGSTATVRTHLLEAAS